MVGVEDEVVQMAEMDVRGCLLEQMEGDNGQLSE